MGKAEYGSPKYIAKQMKSRGLQRLRWYCQVCEKQCRDENGFKCHTQAPSHAARVREKGDTRHMEEYSREFEAEFLRVLRLAHGTKPVSANRVYNEYIHNKTHVHMSATKWPSLAAFVRHLAATGRCSVSTPASDGPPDFVLELVDRRADEQRARQELAKEQRALETERIAQAVQEAQLEAARQDTLHSAEAVEPEHKPEHKPEHEHTPSTAPEDHSSANTGADAERPAGTAGPAKPAKISFSLARKR